MGENDRKCFFISPIGEEGSDERDNSDYVMHFLLIPVLARLGFNTETLRSDQANTASITKEMRKRLKEADLCIADITGHNPNVMWECGYRAATGGELIVLCAEDDATEMTKPVFDMYDDRKILYDYCTSKNHNDRRRREAIKQDIRDRVQRFLDSESKKQSDNIDEEIASIHQILTTHSELLKRSFDQLLRIERRLNESFKELGPTSVGTIATEIKIRKPKL